MGLQPTTFFFFLGSGYYPSFSSANMFHMLSLNSEPSMIFLHNMKKESMKRGRTCGSSKTNCTCGKQQMKQLIIRKYKNREHSGLAVWRVQVRASNQTGTDDLYLLLWQYTFFLCISSEQSNGSCDLRTLAVLFKLIVRASPSVNYLCTQGTTWSFCSLDSGWLAGSSWLDLGPVTVDGWGRLKGLWRGPDG